MTMSRRLLKIFREGDSTTALGKLCQCSIILTEKGRLASSYLYHLFRYLHTLMKWPLSLLFSKMKIHSSLFFLTGKMLHFPYYFYGHLLDCLKELHISLLLWSPDVNTALQMWPHWGRVEGEITSLDLLFLIYPRILLQYKYLWQYFFHCSFRTLHS